MTVVNPKSISGINSITTGSGSDNLLTIHTSDASNTERVRINSSGDVIVGSGVTLSPDGDGFFTGVITATSYSGIDLSAVTGATGDFSIADKIVHTGDTDTAIRFPAADTITLETAGSERFRILSDGKIGIGTDTPLNPLDVHGSSADILIYDTDAYSANSNGAAISLQGNDSAGNRKTLADVRGVANGANRGEFSISTRNTSGQLTEALRIDSSQNVGIGTDDPQEIFHVKAASEAIGNRDGVIFGSTDQLAADKGLPLVWAAHIGTDQDYGIASICGRKENATSDNGAGYLQFGTGTAAGAIVERMRIDSAGRMGLGTNNPEYLLNVVSSDVDTCRFQQTTNNDATSYSLIFMKHAAATSGSNGVDITFQNSAGTTVGMIDHGQSTTQYRTSSDYRLKENATTISDGITRLKTLKPYQFNWIAEKGQPKVDGFFAHEVASAVPEAISGTKDQVDSDNNPVYQAIDHSKLVPLLTAALQEAITEIETLKTKVAALESA